MCEIQTLRLTDYQHMSQGLSDPEVFSTTEKKTGKTGKN
jgi:hypothetical protein